MNPSLEVPMNATLNARSRAWVRRARRGMSLVEVMIVIAIIVTLMAIVGGGAFYIFNNQALPETTRIQLMDIAKRVDIYALKKKGPPSMSEGLKAVFPDGEVPTDGWGNAFVYVVPGPNNSDYDIVSYGNDGAEGGAGGAEDIRLSDSRK
jgi:general secretion pathway protein G